MAAAGPAEVAVEFVHVMNVGATAAQKVCFVVEERTPLGTSIEEYSLDSLLPNESVLMVTRVLDTSWDNAEVAPSAESYLKRIDFNCLGTTMSRLGRPRFESASAKRRLGRDFLTYLNAQCPLLFARNEMREWVLVSEVLHGLCDAQPGRWDEVEVPAGTQEVRILEIPGEVSTIKRVEIVCTDVLGHVSVMPGNVGQLPLVLQPRDSLYVPVPESCGPSDRVVVRVYGYYRKL